MRKGYITDHSPKKDEKLRKIMRDFFIKEKSKMKLCPNVIENHTGYDAGAKLRKNIQS